MPRTLIKICGITRPEDALAATRLGADFVGLVLHASSPRAVSIPRAREIAQSLPETVTPVGLFVDAPVEVVRQSCQTIGLTHVQLHGGESTDYCSRIGQRVIWKMLLVNEHLHDQLRQWQGGRAAAIVAETAGAGLGGGSGIENDWPAVAGAGSLLRQSGLKLIAAGGLTPENVGGVVRLLLPWAVDVSSGVEGMQKGIKSEEKMAAFVHAVREADRI
jgi:phosphoribosylanthranilate isomerase